MTLPAIEPPKCGLDYCARCGDERLILDLVEDDVSEELICWKCYERRIMAAEARREGDR